MPEVPGWLRERHERAETDRAARELLDQVSRPVLVPGQADAAGSPSWLLRADQQVVRFVQRPELGRLRVWCGDPGEPVMHCASSQQQRRFSAAVRTAGAVQRCGCGEPGRPHGRLSYYLRGNRAASGSFAPRTGDPALLSTTNMVHQKILAALPSGKNALTNSSESTAITNKSPGPGGRGGGV